MATRYLFVEFCNKPICLVYHISLIKDYNLKRHYESRHEADNRYLIGELREKAIAKLRGELVQQKEIIRKPVTDNKSVVNILNTKMQGRNQSTPRSLGIISCSPN